MLATFCLRLASGLMLALLVLSPAQVPPRFFRVQYLTTLALVAVAGFFARAGAGPGLWLALGAALVVSCAGSVVWHVEGHPGQGVVLVLANAAVLGSMLIWGHAGQVDPGAAWLAADNLSSAAVLGSAMSAMLMGHAYLIAPAMTLNPLYRLLAALGVALAARIGLACLVLHWWTRGQAAGNLGTEELLWLGVRWLVGLVGPLVLGWLAWETARIRSTQSATGILYVVVIFCFVGELTSQLLLARTELVR